MRSRYMLFAVFAVVAALAVAFAPDSFAAYMDPGKLALGIAIAGIVGDIDLMKARELREKRANLIDLNGKVLASIQEAKSAEIVKQLEAEWDKRDAEIVSLTK